MVRAKEVGLGNPKCTRKHPDNVVEQHDDDDHSEADIGELMLCLQTKSFGSCWNITLRKPSHQEILARNLVLCHLFKMLRWKLWSRGSKLQSAQNAQDQSKD